MPGLDVSFVTADPLLADSFRVTRRVDVVDGKGRTSPTATEVHDPVIGVITQEKSDLMRGDNGQTVPRVIFVATKFPLRGESAQDGLSYQPDVVTWCCNDYIVKSVQPYSRFGAGHVQALCESTRVVDTAAGRS